MTRMALLAMAGLFMAAAGPQGSFIPVAPMGQFPPSAMQRPGASTTVTATAPGFTAAPTPNMDNWGPPPAKRSKDTSVTPGIFTRKDQRRGDGYAYASSAQIEEDRRALPGAGINLSMPLQ
jgi:hypothetical protein